MEFQGITIPQKAITEISGKPGSGKTELLLRTLAQQPQKRIAWLEEKFTFYPCSLLRAGISPGKILFIESEDYLLWAAAQILRSGLFGVVVLSLAGKSL
ncbi:MAG: hypothetical protein AB1540_16575, partial [Bdellovibrionota bacterium]